MILPPYSAIFEAFAETLTKCIPNLATAIKELYTKTKVFASVNALNVLMAHIPDDILFAIYSVCWFQLRCSSTCSLLRELWPISFC